ncbi:MAG TPA: cold shock domain-containing protein [Cyclobacteriaceae bacterium]|nr:cold shock domain-containing protein [Cyclobacteriaceae bacterium]MCB0498404.1 cold shock domain-containing protein [Cyclobacteriaceae bacterium]MCB9237026.1 cold shock domain-containing protein [Flammeovirgaceae bacterium]MCW5901264.1 cold shock domain-containing protein [Cyclobacteriaceae bacterium]HOO09519.1 cold shock domain-containing protein [Cyclobacteriaceae bacterium]
MGKSQETWNKKQKEKKRQKKRDDKEQKKQERKANPTKSSLDDMLAYVDEFGNITSTPPDPTKKKASVKLEDIEVSVPKQAPVDPADLVRKGSVTFFNDSKGYGFIKDLESQESIFVHVNELSEPIQEKDKVTFEVEMGQKGPAAVNVKLIKGE